MTQEEKLKEAKRLYESANADQRYVLESLFPELKESEDERIRKAIHIYLDWLDGRKDYAPKGEYSIRDMIAWLEAQGEHANFRNKIQVGDKVTRNEDGVLVNLSQLNRVAKKDEKQGEQNPADKVEPKFKVGDWIISHYNNVAYIESISETKYNLRCKDGYHEKLDIDCINRNWRLWTIQDAKEGDVLVYDNGCVEIILLFKKWMDEVGKGAYSYVHITSSGRHIHINDWSDCGLSAYPATKEQCDLLFQKIHEAGYEWDAEKKELKKIEQKPAQTEMGAKGNEREIPNSAWSERDEQMLGLSVENLTELKDRFGKEYGRTGDCIDWLKSLKDRVQSQPKQEWSEEDRKIIIELIGIFESAIDGGHVSFPYRLIKDYIRVLKSCLNQNTWKPSIAQLNALSIVSKGNAPDDIEAIVSLCNDLKKLREE